MNLLLDAILAAIILLIIIVNTFKGFKTVLNLLVTIVSFGAAIILGPVVGQLFATDVIYDKVAEFVRNIVDSVVGESVGSLTVGDLVAQLPESLISLLEKAGTSIDAILGSVEKSEIISEEAIAGFVDKITAPIADGLAVAAGCVIVFVAALLLMLLFKALVMMLLKDPAFKGVGRFFGFIVGLFSAFVWGWIICLAIGLLAQYSLLGEYNSILVELTETSYIYNFFDNLSLQRLIEMLTAK